MANSPTTLFTPPPNGTIASASALPLGSAPSGSEWPDAGGGRRSAGELAGEINAQLVSLFREHSGRGPTKAKTSVSSTLVVTTLGDCLTGPEQKLRAAGHQALVDRYRAAMHQTMRAEANAIVEEHLHRQVAAYLTDQRYDPDVAVLIFFLAPRD